MLMDYNKIISAKKEKEKKFFRKFENIFWINNITIITM